MSIFEVGMVLDTRNKTSDNQEWFLSPDDVKKIPNLLDIVNEAPCDITNKCCNQFGERDEMQRIINSLQTDVIARGARIKILEDAIEEMEGEMTEAVFILQSNSETRINDALTTLNAPYRELSDEKL